MVFLSISARYLVNIESLNGVESIGNLARHRVAPIVTCQQGNYSIRYVPAISGESLAHAFQENLLKEACSRKLPLGLYSSRGEFFKFTSEEILKDEGITIPQSQKDIRRVEAEILLKDVIADIGGFLYAGKQPIKRTSRFAVGYMIPAVKELEASALEAQFHVRHSATKDPAPYNVEIGSAVFTLTVALDVSGIAVLSTRFGDKVKDEEELGNQKEARVKAALTSLQQLLTSNNFGAKRSRFLPNMEPLSAVGMYSSEPYLPHPGNDKDFIRTTVKRVNDYKNSLKKLGSAGEIILFAFDNEGAAEGAEIEKTATLEGMLGSLTSLAIK